MIEEIKKDRLRTKKAKDEDVAFLQDQLGERKFRIGSVDEEYVKTVEEKIRKAEAEERRKIVSNETVKKELEGKIFFEEEEDSTEEDIEDEMFNDEVLDDEDGDKDYLPIKRKRNKAERKVKRVKKESKNYVTVRLPRDILSDSTLITAKRFKFGNQGITSVVATLLSRAKNPDNDESIDSNKFHLSREKTRNNVTKTMHTTAATIKEKFKEILNPHPKTLCLDFDGKLVQEQSLCLKEAKQRLAILVESLSY